MAFLSLQIEPLSCPGLRNKETEAQLGRGRAPDVPPLLHVSFQIPLSSSQPLAHRVPAIGSKRSETGGGFPLSVLSCFSEVLLFLCPSGFHISCFNSFLPTSPHLPACLSPSPGQVPLPWKAHWSGIPAPHFPALGRHKGPSTQLQDGGCLQVAFCPAKGPNELLNNVFLLQPRRSDVFWAGTFPSFRSVLT